MASRSYRDAIVDVLKLNPGMSVEDLKKSDATIVIATHIIESILEDLLESNEILQLGFEHEDRLTLRYFPVVTKIIF